MARWKYVGNVNPHDGTVAISITTGHYVAMGEEFDADEEHVDRIRHLFFIERVEDSAVVRAVPFVSESDDELGDEDESN